MRADTTMGQGHQHATSAPASAGPISRLRQVCWEALEGLGGPACAALFAVLGGDPAERVLDRLLRARRELSGPQRRALAEAVFGVALWRRRLAVQAGLASWEGAAPGVLLGTLLRLGGLDRARAQRLGGSPLPEELVEPATLADRTSLPEWLAATLERELGPEAEACAAALCLPGPICLRANRLRGGRDALARALEVENVATRPAAHAPHGLIVEGARPNLLGLDAQARGLFEPQDEGSQLVGALLEAKAGETILDACAGAGGKTLLLAAEVSARGRVIAVDPDRERLARLRARARRAGAEFVEIAGPRIPEGLSADAAIVDAPCSALGPLRRGPDARWLLRPAGFSALPGLQLALLDATARVLRPGGRLVYATCTLRREENEEVALAFERTHPHFLRAAPGAGWLDPGFVRSGFFFALPHRHGTDGFFAALWRRKDAA